MKFVRDFFTLKELAQGFEYGSSHGKFLDWFFRFRSSSCDFFVCNCNDSSYVWLVLVANKPYRGFPYHSRRVVIVGSWRRVCEFIVHATSNPYGNIIEHSEQSDDNRNDLPF